jgi:hypothetical protein
MGSFKRSLFGYRGPEVDAAIFARDSRIAKLRREIATQAEVEAAARAEVESEVSSLSGMVIEREREIRTLGEALREANQRAERSIESLTLATGRLKEIEAQARGQATRIRMKALREAVEISRRVQEVSEADAAIPAAAPEASNGHAEIDPQAVFEGIVRVEIGPLGDFAQLVGLENAVSQLGATDISVERFSEGRATLSLNLDEPVDLLRELEERSPLEFRVRRAADDNLVLDVDEETGPDQQVA